MFSKKKSDKVSTLILEQVKDVEECLILFENFMRAATTEGAKIETLNSLAGGISQAENAADKSLRKMIDTLLNAPYLPSTKEGIISIATSCDKVANKFESVVTSIVVQKFSFPAGFGEEILEILKITREQFALLQESIELLFTRLNVLIKDHEILDRIRALESKVDTIESNIYRRVFEMDVELARKTQIARVIEGICDPSDIIEDIADKIQIMLISRKA